jgi:hypothetical protein
VYNSVLKRTFVVTVLTTFHILNKTVNAFLNSWQRLSGLVQ